MSAESNCLEFEQPVLLLGGADVPVEQLHPQLARGFALVAADGGANQLLGSEVIPDAIIGDMDSLAHRDNWARRCRTLHIAEQDSTDFEKCLYSTHAPWYLALGFCGQRLDHTLASLHVLVRRLKTHNVLLLSEDDVILVCEGSVRLEMSPGARLSIFPLTAVEFKSSSGLLYPLHGLQMAIGSSIGTSNSVSESTVNIEVDADSDGYFALIAPIAEQAAFETLISSRSKAGN